MAGTVTLRGWAPGETVRAYRATSATASLGAELASGVANLTGEVALVGLAAGNYVANGTMGRRMFSVDPSSDGGATSTIPARAVPLYPEDFGALGDVVCMADAAISAGSAIVTSASGAFATARPGQLFSAGNAATGPNALHTRISSVQSATQVTLEATAGINIASAWASFGTDDTTALQTCINTASADGRTVMLSTWYVTTLEIAVTGNVRILGTGWFPLIGDFAATMPTGQGPGVPWVPPFLSGCGLHVMASGLRSALAFVVQGLAPHLEDWAIRFAAPFWNTGDGVYAKGHPTNKGNGVQNALWKNIGVFGVDGNSYGFRLRNFFQMKFCHLRSWGGGKFWLEHDNGLWAYGNSQFDDCTGKIFVGGTAHGWTFVKGGGGPLNQISTLTPGFNAVDPSKYFTGGLFNGRTIPPTTGSQKVLDAPGTNINGLSLIGFTWDTAGEPIATATLPTAQGPSGGAGLFVDPGGYQNPVSQDGRMIIAPGYGGAVYNPINHTRVSTVNVTVSTAGDVLYEMDCTGGARTVTLPSRASFRGMRIGIVKTDASGNTASFVPAGSDTIQGVNSPRAIGTQWKTEWLRAGQNGWVLDGAA